MDDCPACGASFLEARREAAEAQQPAFRRAIADAVHEWVSSVDLHGMSAATRDSIIAAFAAGAVMKVLEDLVVFPD